MTLYQTIANTIEKQITAGVYKPGEKIPPIRAIAELFGCNKLTAQRAFEELKRMRLIENIVGSGSYVRFPETVQTVDSGFDFKSDYLSETFFPYKIAQQLLNDLFEFRKWGVLAPPPPSGDVALLQVLGGFYQVPVKRMLIISGAQQGLDLIGKVFEVRIAQSMLFEDPTYPGAISLFRACHFVNMAADGPNIEQFDTCLTPGIRLFYSMPAVHNPTGVAYSLAKKQAIARRAAKHPFYIIEDDCLSEFAPASARFLDLLPEKTIYIKSLSQTTISGLRLGFMIVPEHLYDKFLYAKFTSDIASNGLIQQFLERFIAEGHYAAHLQTIRARIKTRKQVVSDLLNQFSGFTCPSRQHGYSLWVSGPEPLATAVKVPWNQGATFSFNLAMRRYFKLAFMNMDDPAFERSITGLKEFLLRSGAVLR